MSPATASVSAASAGRLILAGAVAFTSRQHTRRAAVRFSQLATATTTTTTSGHPFLPSAAARTTARTITTRTITTATRTASTTTTATAARCLRRRHPHGSGQRFGWSHDHRQQQQLPQHHHQQHHQHRSMHSTAPRLLPLKNSSLSTTTKTTATTSPTTTTTSTLVRNNAAAANAAANVEKKPSLWTRVKHEAKHYWLGTKLLAKETSISSRLAWKMMRGSKLTRREHTQLVRTAKDLFRLIPFSIFIIVPFMELLLPVALKLFPEMLPSTYTDKEKEFAKRRQVMATKLNMAKFLRESIAESAVSAGPRGEAAQELSMFFKKYRSGGERASTTEILTICKKFSDDLTLDNLSRPQLVTMCRFMGVNAFGTDNFLRFSLRKHMQEIHDDDQMIDSEGIDSLTVSELVSACQTRGIRTLDTHPDRLRYELQQWLDLNIKNEIPPTILILSRALMMTDQHQQLPTAVGAATDTAEALQSTLASLPDEVLEEAELRISEAEGKISVEEKLALIQKEEERIADELAEASSEVAAVTVATTNTEATTTTEPAADASASATTAAAANTTVTAH